MKYVDGFVIVVPEKNLPAYRKMAKEGQKIWKKYGALEYFECVGNDLAPEWATLTFPKMAKAKEGETVVFSFIVYKSKADRDKVNAKVMQDPVMNDPKNRDRPDAVRHEAYGVRRVPGHCRGMMPRTAPDAPIPFDFYPAGPGWTRQDGSGTNRSASLTGDPGTAFP